MKGVYVCRGTDPAQVSSDVPLSFLNDCIVDAATAVIDFQKCLWSLRDWGTEKKQTKKSINSSEIPLKKEAAKSCKAKDSAVRGNLCRNEENSKDDFIKKLKQLLMGIVVKHSTSSATEFKTLTILKLLLWCLLYRYSRKI